MGSNHKRLFWVCLIAAVALLAIGYALADRWLVVLVFPIIILAWWITKRPDLPWLTSALLVVYILEAAGGVLLGVSPAVMIAGVAMMLMGWELAGQLKQQPEALLQPLNGELESSQVKLLVISLAIGLLFAEGGLFVRLSVPFGVIVLAGLLVLFSLYRFYRLTSKS